MVEAAKPDVPEFDPVAPVEVPMAACFCRESGAAPEAPPVDAAMPLGVANVVVAVASGAEVDAAGAPKRLLVLVARAGVDEAGPAVDAAVPKRDAGPAADEAGAVVVADAPKSAEEAGAVVDVDAIVVGAEDTGDGAPNMVPVAAVEVAPVVVGVKFEDFAPKSPPPKPPSVPVCDFAVVEDCVAAVDDRLPNKPPEPAGALLVPPSEDPPTKLDAYTFGPPKGGTPAGVVEGGNKADFAGVVWEAAAMVDGADPNMADLVAPVFPNTELPPAFVVEPPKDPPVAGNEKVGADVVAEAFAVFANSPPDD